MTLRFAYDVLIVFAVPAFVVVFGMFVLRFAKWREAPVKRLGPSVLVAGIVLYICVPGISAIDGYATRRARASVTARLASMESPYVVRVEGMPARDPKAVIAALETLNDLPAAHSAPSGKRLLVVVTASGRSLALVLVRDSKAAGEYWVYLTDDDPTGNPPNGAEIGGVSTTALDAF